MTGVQTCALPIPLHIKDVGIIYDTSVHDIDTANWLFDDMPLVVFARSGRINHEHEDFASIMLGYKNDKVAIISSNWITPKKVRTFTAVCTDAIITSDFISLRVDLYSGLSAIYSLMILIYSCRILL